MSEKDKNNLGKKKDERRDLHFGVAYFFIYITHLFISLYFKNTSLASKRSFNKDIFQNFCESYIYI